MKELKSIVSDNEWNKIAQKYNSLSSVSLENMSQKDFETLQSEIRASQYSSLNVPNILQLPQNYQNQKKIETKNTDISTLVEVNYHQHEEL